MNSNQWKFKPFKIIFGLIVIFRLKSNPFPELHKSSSIKTCEIFIVLTWKDQKMWPLKCRNSPSQGDVKWIIHPNYNNNNCKNKSKATCDFMFKLNKIYPVYFIDIDNELESD